MKTKEDLTQQERHILALVARGLRNAEIAERLCISIRTVEGHLYRIFQKLNVSSRTEAAIYALHRGLLPTPESSGNTGDSQSQPDYYGSQVNGSISEPS
jgi:DNA-binding CsgD family transcriptional regulator